MVFPPPSTKHFTSAIYLKVSSTQNLSLHIFPQTAENFISALLLSVGLYIEDGLDIIFQVPLGPHSRDFYLMSQGTFKNLTNSYGRDIKPKERLIKVQ